MSIYHLVYRSFATKEFSEEGYHKLLESSRKRNEESNITGLLLFRNGVFLQLLEGPESAVKNVYSMICKENRHERVVTLVETASDARIYEKWAMASVDNAPLDNDPKTMLPLFETLFQAKKTNKAEIFSILKKFQGALEN